MRNHQKNLSVLRKGYLTLCEALPWLDMSVWEDDEPRLRYKSSDMTPPCMQTQTIAPGSAVSLSRLKSTHGPFLLRYNPDSPMRGEQAVLMTELAQQRLPLVIRHTDMDLEEIGCLAGRWPDTAIIIESGELKILYFFEQVEQLLAEHSNLYLCTFNLCNWLGLERLCRRGLGKKLLFGSHRPRYSIHAAMGPVALGKLSWGEKCDIAGNNLRRLLSLPSVTAKEPVVAKPHSFIIDAHCHSGANGRFRVPDEAFSARDWLEFMDQASLERIFICPMEAVMDVGRSSRSCCSNLLEAAPQRISYFHIFNPGGDKKHYERLEECHFDSACVGIKIHPSFHEVAADDAGYRHVYQLADQWGMPIMTHSWECSTANLRQRLSHPSLFRRHLKEHPQLNFILGHAGGRPGAMDAVVELCREFPGVRVDLSGDYYDSGLVDYLVDTIGAARILFGSDMNWIDPRINLAQVLGAHISDRDALRILRNNAVDTYMTALRNRIKRK